MKQRTIFFDMDGTIADLYGVKNWLQMLRNYDVTPYKIAHPMFDKQLFTNLLLKIKQRGYKLGIISWLSKDPNPTYGQAVTITKIEWLYEQLTGIIWDEIYIVPHGVPKSNFKKTNFDILFDDEEKNRIDWGTTYAYPPQMIEEILTQLN